MSQLRLRSLGCVPAILLGLLGFASNAHAFTIENNFNLCNPGPVVCPSGPGVGQTLDVRATVEGAPRWSATPVVGNIGLHDGIQVSVEAGLAAELGAANATEVDLVNAAVLAAFDAWETPVLQFDITLDSPSSGFEIDLFAVPDSHPVFASNDFTGFSQFFGSFQATRGITNSTNVPGFAITEANIFLNIDKLLEARVQLCFLDLDPTCSPTEDALALAGLQNLMTHEIGHAIGLDHPFEFLTTNLDTDGDPLTLISVDIMDPPSGLAVSLIDDPDSIMNGTLPTNPSRSFNANFFTSLRPDDVSGRDVLYPNPFVVPEAGTLGLSGMGLGALTARCWRRRRHG